ncbi:hypothetical protein J437_LFUL014934, partial [Ladona fulva]
MQHLKSRVKPWMVNVASGRSSKEFWPPTCQYLNPLNFYVWNIVQRISNKCRHPNVTSLKTATEAAFASMDKDNLQCASEHFR